MKTTSRSRRPRSTPHRTGAAREHVYATRIGQVLHSWLRDTPVSRAERRWLDAACKLGLDHAIALHGPDAHESHAMTMAVVGRAAEQIWAATGGAPRWSALDVDAAIERWSPHGDASFVDAVAWTLAAFVTWLGEQKILTEDELQALDVQLDGQLDRVLRTLLGEPAARALN